MAYMDPDPIDLRSKENMLLESLQDYFSDHERLERIIPINRQESDISLRILDAFVTKYSKTNNTVYSVGEGTRKRVYFVHNDYKNQLKAYSKTRFDPFRRGKGKQKFYFPSADDPDRILTTVGQLNFFRWAIQNGVLDYVEKNLEKISATMNRKDKGESRKKKLSVSAKGEVQDEKVRIVVSFD